MVNVVLGVTGSVAGIKVAELLQLLSQGGATVRVACSEHGAVFIEQPQHDRAPPVYYSDRDDYEQVLTKRKADVSGNMVGVNHGQSNSEAANGALHSTSAKQRRLLQQTGSNITTAPQDECTYEKTSARKVPLHIELAEWGDVLLIAPLSANTMAKIALGMCDNLVSRTFRCWEASKAVLVAPAMNTKMWNHAATSRHLKELQEFGVAVIEPVSKTLACGDVGVGAMASVADIVAATLMHLRRSQGREESDAFVAGGAALASHALSENLK